MNSHELVIAAKAAALNSVFGNVELAEQTLYWKLAERLCLFYDKDVDEFILPKKGQGISDNPYVDPYEPELAMRWHRAYERMLVEDKKHD